MGNHKIEIVKDKKNMIIEIKLDNKKLIGVKDIIVNNHYKPYTENKEITIVLLDSELTESFLD